jgi:cytochrome c5
MIRKTVTTLILMLAVGSALAAEQVTDERLQQGWIVFNRTCSVCHWPGIGGAPAIGNKAAWKDHEQVRAAVDYIIHYSR